jgi:AraC family transcriptional regulator
LPAGIPIIEAPVPADDNPLRFEEPPAGPHVRHVRRHLPPMVVTDTRVAAAISQIESDFSREHALVDLAAQVGLSPFHFHRLFAEVMGETVGGFMRRTRMDCAAIHLLSSPDSIQAIADKVGYGSLASFNHAFNRQFGVAPTRYRELARQAVFHISAEDVERSRRVRVEPLESLSLVGVRFYGGYDAVENYWKHFAGMLRDSGIALNGLQAYALIVDNPEITPNGLIRYYCAVVDPGLPDPLPAPLERYRIGAGRYACLRHEGSYRDIFPVYFAISPVWLQRNNMRFGLSPALERYEREPWLDAGGAPSVSVMIHLS